jgi:hypothetical protein
MDRINYESMITENPALQDMDVEVPNKDFDIGSDHN